MRRIFISFLIVLFMALMVILPLGAQDLSATVAASEDEYIELRSWDVVTARRDTYLGKKVSIESYYAGIADGILGNPPTVNLPKVSYFCTFTEEVLDKLLELEQSILRNYRFYGTVIIGFDRSPALQIEDVKQGAP